MNHKTIKIIKGILFAPFVLVWAINVYASLLRIREHTPTALGAIAGITIFALLFYWLIYKMPSLVYRLFKKKDTQQVPSSSS